MTIFQFIKNICLVCIIYLNLKLIFNINKYEKKNTQTIIIFMGLHAYLWHYIFIAKSTLYLHLFALIKNWINFFLRFYFTCSWEQKESMAKYKME